MSFTLSRRGLLTAGTAALGSTMVEAIGRG